MRRAVLLVLALLLAGCGRDDATGEQGAPTPPDARAVASTALPRLGEPVRFEAPGAAPGERAEWAFGDGATATGTSVSHAYTTPGRYVVSLTVTNPEGRAGTNDAAPLFVSILPPTVDATRATRAPAPFAIAASSAQLVQAGGEVRFDARGSGIWRGPPFALTTENASFSWDFGDGDVRVGATLARGFPDPGVFPVVLTVADEAAGAASSYVLTILALRQQPTPLALREPDLFVDVGVDEPATLDPARLADDAGAHVVRQVYERLYAYAPGATSLAPALAASMPETSADRTVLTVRLRENVTFHDGSRLSAHDVKASLDRLVAIDDPRGPAWTLKPVLREVEVVDERTVRFRLEVSDPAFLHKLAHEGASIVPARAASDPRGLDTRAVGTGPYRLAEWSPGQPIVLERHDAYWGERPAVAVVLRQKAVDLDTRLAMIASGQADGIVVPPGAEESILSLPGVRAIESPSWATSALGFNERICGGPDAPGYGACAFRHADAIPRSAEGAMVPLFFADANMRAAWSLAFDREAYARDVLGGRGTLLAGPLPAGMLGHDPDLAPPVRDLDAARAALAATDHADGFRVTLFYNEGNAVREATARLLADNVRALSPGIDIAVAALPHEDGFLPRQRDRALPIEFLAWTPDYAFPDDYAVTFGHSELGVYAAHVGYRNEDLDALLDRLLRETDEERLAAGYAEATRIMNGDHAYVWLAQGTSLSVQREWVHGDAYHPLARGQPLVGEYARVSKG
jgi:peptide/nickel transport system substrate-binding protein